MQAQSQLDELLPRIRQLLQPLANVVVGRVSYDVLSELLKDALIDAAREKLRLEEPAKRITKSAIALKTGIDSRSIDLQSKEKQGGSELSHPFADLLASWQWESDWLDTESGRPLVLPIYGPGRSFQTLVNRTVGKNISYSDVMEALLKSGNIERADDKRLRLLDPFFKFGASELESGRFDFYGRLSHGLSLCIHNRMSSPEFDPTPNAVWMTVRSVPERDLPALAEKIGALLLRHADEAGDTLDAHDDEKSTGRTYSAGVGNFFWTRRNE